MSLQRYILIAIGIVIGALSLSGFPAAPGYRAGWRGGRIDAAE